MANRLFDIMKNVLYKGIDLDKECALRGVHVLYTDLKLMAKFNKVDL